MSRQDTETFAWFAAQNGNGEQRLTEFAGHPKMAAISVATLHIPGRLDPKASLDMMTMGGFTLDQGRTLRQAGFGLAPERDIAREASLRQLPMEHSKVRLEVKVREREAFEKINVRSPPSLLAMPLKLTSSV